MSNLPLNLHSKTHQGLIGILAVAVVMALAGKLTPELVDVLKFVAGGFFATRAVANYSEGKQSGS